MRRVVVDGAAVERWNAVKYCLPLSDQDRSQLPPLGSQAVAHLTLVRCKKALSAARDAKLLDASVVTATIEIIHQAFNGIGPAAEVAAIIRRDASS